MSNNYGFFSQGYESRYGGLFFKVNNEVYKVLDTIEKKGPIKKIINKFSKIERIKGGNKETFSFHKGCFCYHLKYPEKIGLYFDVKKMFDNGEYGRYYKVTRGINNIIIEFTKKNDSNDFVEYKLYIIISGDIINWKKVEEWVKREYVVDEKRNSKPYERHVFHGIDIFGKNICIACSDNLSNCYSLMQSKKIGNNKSFITFSSKIDDKLAFLCSQNALYELMDDDSIIAGLPWFFQDWSRDELISLGALLHLKKYDTLKKMLNKYLFFLNNKNGIPNILNEKNYNADSIGWFYFRFYHFLFSINKAGKLNDIFTLNEINNIKIVLSEFFTSYKNKNVVSGLISNLPQETWMDSILRDGYRIEIQCLHLVMCKLMFFLTKDDRYQKLEGNARIIVKEKFWNGSYLTDGLNDATIRPNIFLAAYIYPELLQKEEWEKCFDNALKKLWLDWGGLSSVDKENESFCQDYTGEVPRSYHNGDSWFWINNIAAICMFRINRRKYKDYIKKIYESSKADMLWKGSIGHGSEISSASKLESNGCLNQAWSNATFIELWIELNKVDNY